MINFKRFISVILSLIMMLIMFKDIPVNAVVDTEEYTYDNYTVEYTVSNEWTGNQSVEVKITNTGEESILNWALKYDAKGEISGLWNAVSVSNEGNTHLIKNAGYNYEIAPDRSVTFGYTLSGENLSAPEDFELSSKRIDSKEENYIVELSITEEWDTGFKGEIMISNISDAPIEAWQLSFDSNFSVSDIWNCRILEYTDGKYVIASEAWINPILPDSSVEIGIVGTKTDEQAVEISNVILSEVVIDYNLPEQQDPVGEMLIIVFGEYVAETDSIDISWMSTVSDGAFEILASDDNKEYTVIGNCENSDNYSIPADFTKKYIKVKQTNGNQTAESEPFAITMTSTGYIIDFIDSDNDGLYDYAEDSIGTDKNLPDTDNDNLTDCEEVYILGTDPIVYDSIVSGTSDGDADPDNDGLSNRYELDNGTNPLCDDTDSDGLKDGEEIKEFGTDPLKYDTDDDEISDGDEIVLGLDPINSFTDGIPDNERIFEQEIDSDSEIMSCINTEDNAFEMSIDISAAGNAENCVVVSESGYSTVIQNDAVLGAIPEINYTNGLAIEKVSVKFEIKEEYIDNGAETYSDCEEMSGIKRLNIFRYFEEENILLPVETKFDTENNMVYTDVDRLGTYCLIDMEKWFESVGVSDSDIQEQQMTFSYDNYYNYYDSYENDSDKIDEFNEFVVVFGNMFYEYESSNNLSLEKSMIFHSSVLATKQYSNYKITILNDNNQPIVSKRGKDYATNIEELRELCDNIQENDFNSDYKNQKALEYYCCVSTGACEKANKEAYDMLEGVVYKDMNLQTLFENSEWDSRKNIMSFIDTGVDNINIVLVTGYFRSNEEYAPKQNPSQILTATGLKPLPSDFDDVSDYDNDGLINAEEIDWESSLIKNKSLRTYDNLPTIDDCISHFSDKGELSYVQNGLTRLQALPGSVYSELMTIRILPINSDPLSVDGDGDELLDNDYQRNDNGDIIAPIDEHPLKIDGPIGAWQNHIDVLNNPENIVPTVLDKWYGDKQPEGEQTNYGAEGFSAFKEELDYLEEQGKLKLSDSQKNMILTFSAPFVTGAVLSLGEMGKNVDDNIALNTSKISFSIIMATIESGITNENERDEIMASLGSRLLNFKADNQEIIHSQNKQWQLIGGYNNLYDNVFREYTNYTMRNEKFAFTVNNFDYILWIWRGNYLNLGAGAEMGLYYRPTILPSDPDGLDHYFAHSELALPMQLYLYDYESGENIFSWEPTEDQWWITGFNPKCKGEKADAKNQVMIGSVQFPNDKMYEAIKMNVRVYQKQYVIFDDAHYTIWLCWYDGGMKE